MLVNGRFTLFFVDVKLKSFKTAYWRFRSIFSCLSSEMPQSLGMPMKNTPFRRRHKLLPTGRRPIRPNNTSDIRLLGGVVPNESQKPANGMGALSAQQDGRMRPENQEFLVPGLESILGNTSPIWIKEEPDGAQDDISNEEFDSQLQSSMEMIFECDDPESSGRTMMLLPTTENANDLRIRYEEEIARKDRQIEELKKQINIMKLKNKNCKYCKLFANVSPEVISFVENLLAAMKSHKEPPLSCHDVEDPLCHTTAEVAQVEVPGRFRSKMVPLYPGTDVMISEQAKTLAVLRANGNPRKLISCTLKALFTTEELSGFSACGQRENKPFPANVTNAMKMFVITTCTPDGCHPLLSESQFHKILNARFGIARRDLKRDVEKNVKGTNCIL